MGLYLRGLGIASAGRKAEIHGLSIEFAIRRLELA